MTLYADIGNSRIKLAIFSGISKIDMFFSIEHNENKLKEALTIIRKNYPIEEVLYACAAKRYICMFSESVKNIFNKLEPVLFERESIPITNSYENKSEVGIDRLLSAYAAAYLNKDKGFDVHIVIDFGSATTLGVITKDFCFLGGMIMSGLYTSFTDLSAKTKLPFENLAEEIKQNTPYPIAKSTKNSLQAGMFYQSVGAANFAISEIKKTIISEYSFKNITLSITGGNSSIIGKYIEGCIMYPSLVLDGLYIASKKEHKN